MIIKDSLLEDNSLVGGRMSFGRSVRLLSTRWVNRQALGEASMNETDLLKLRQDWLKLELSRVSRIE